MLIGTKDLSKLAAITVVSCCAVFVCTLFLSYNSDIVGIKDLITSPQGMVMYEAQVATGRVVTCVTGGCLVATTVVMLIFYIKNYIDSHGKELGVLKALGHSRPEIARHFYVFGISVLAGAIIGCVGAQIYMPTFYRVQNEKGLLPELTPQPHPYLTAALILLPTAFFMLLAVLYAFFRMKAPVLSLIKGTRNIKQRSGKKEADDLSYLTYLRRSILKCKKTSVFFVWFSAFCFSAMMQMSMSMQTLSSDTFAWMIMLIGMILAFMTLLMSLSSVAGSSAQTVAMMKAFGYSDRECSRSVLGGYLYIAPTGFAVGTVYQYVLLRIMVDIIFADFEGMPEYTFDVKAFLITAAAFAVTYQLIMLYYSRKISRSTIKSIMTD